MGAVLDGRASGKKERSEEDRGGREELHAVRGDLRPRTVKPKLVRVQKLDTAEPLAKLANGGRWARLVAHVSN
jgi:hypothetical protein